MNLIENIRQGVHLGQVRDVNAWRKIGSIRFRETMHGFAIVYQTRDGWGTHVVVHNDMRAMPFASSTEAITAADQALSDAQVTLDQFRDLVLRSLRIIQVRTGRQGLVTIPALRAEVERAGLRLGRERFDDLLLALGREFTVDLEIAHDPAAVPDRADGIWREGSGLLYYVSKR